MPPRGEWPTRRTYAAVGAAWLAFVIYGSLVPFLFRPLPLAQAIERFTAIPYLHLTIDSRADLVANVLLFVPLGYLLLASLRTDRRSRLAHVVTGGLTVGSCFVLSLLIEFTQSFFPSRTVSLNDILAETSGAVVGVIVWLLVGQALTIWIRDLSRQRRRPALLQRILAVYCVAFLISQLLPLDLTINLGELAQKYRDGRILIHPFAFSYVSWTAMVWDYLGDIALNAPLGAAAVVLLYGRSGHRRPELALAIGAAIVGAVEFAQVFVYSRYADVTDLLTGSIGVAIGVLATTMVIDRAPNKNVSGRLTSVSRTARIGVLVWTAVLLAYHWAPFDFSLDRAHLAIGVRHLFSLPFSSYYAGTEFHAFTEAARKALLALPLGVLLRLAISGRGQMGTNRGLVAAGVGGFLFFVMVEVGQATLPTRVPDLTDAMIGEVGLVVGLYLTGLFIVPRTVQSLPPEVNVGIQPPLMQTPTIPVRLRNGSGVVQMPGLEGAGVVVAGGAEGAAVVVPPDGGTIPGGSQPPL